MREFDVRLCGQGYKIVGNAGDPYFASVEAAIDDLEPLTTWARNNLPADAVVIDAGGNIGLTALIFASLVPRGHVHVFEALPSNVRLLKQNVSLNRITNCTVNPIALGDRTGSIVMQGTGSSSHVAADYATRSVDHGTVPMITLDTYMRERSLDRVDLIKLDVEGFEPAVLEGASRMVEQLRPPVWMEFNSWCLTYVQGFHARDFANALWHAFDVSIVDSAGNERVAGDGSVIRFLHDNVVLHGTVDDVLLRLKADRRVPAKGSVAPPDPDLAREAERLRGELAAIRNSTSWRLTSPIRRVAQMIRGR